MDIGTAIAKTRELNEKFPRGHFVAHDFKEGTCVFRVKQFFIKHLDFYSSDSYTINCDADFGYNVDGEISFDTTFGAQERVRFATESEILKLWGLYDQERLRAIEKNAKEKILPSEIMWVIYSLIKWESENKVTDNFLSYMDANKQYSPTIEDVVKYCKLHHCVDKFINYLFPPDTPLVHPLRNVIKEISSLLDKVK